MRSRERRWGAAHPKRRVCTYYSTGATGHPIGLPRLTQPCIELIPTLVCAALLAGCGSDDPESAAPAPAKQEAALAGAPAPLAKLHSQANELLGGGADAFDARLRGAEGLSRSW